jgi:hypothetical protein
VCQFLYDPVWPRFGFRYHDLLAFLSSTLTVRYNPVVTGKAATAESMALTADDQGEGVIALRAKRATHRKDR